MLLLKWLKHRLLLFGLLSHPVMMVFYWHKVPEKSYCMACYSYRYCRKLLVVSQCSDF